MLYQLSYRLAYAVAYPLPPEAGVPVAAEG
ncbi:MAG: hypothetical protein JWO87_1500 [Phycisphaerales bacterium]|nr:hypothetical protein [Phycisphaerales bacterium]MDB5303517.1 hypothetical protein [Phycisphaerales bacterium]